MGFCTIMNPAVYERKQRKEKIEKTLDKVAKLMVLMEDRSLEKFASQLKREDLLVESVEIWPQFICDWFIDGLSFVAPHWQHRRMR